jgi:multidrug efflux pump subunit AcrA (membrane-fusion protein)
MVFALVGVAILLCAVVLWAVFGQAPDTIRGKGVIIPAGGYEEVGSTDTGVVEVVLVGPGDAVDAGDVVAVLVDNNGRRQELTSTVDGTVVEVRSRPGRITQVGQPLVMVEPDDASFVTKALLPAIEAEVIKPGMSALVSPNGVPSSQYGVARGVVSRVSPTATSQERLLLLLGDNESLADFLLADGPVLEVSIDLLPADTPSGFDWTIGEGPNEALTTSALAEVTVVVEERSVSGWLFQ